MVRCWPTAEVQQPKVAGILSVSTEQPLSGEEVQQLGVAEGSGYSELSKLIPHEPLKDMRPLHGHHASSNQWITKSNVQRLYDSQCDSEGARQIPRVWVVPSES